MIDIISFVRGLGVALCVCTVAVWLAAFVAKWATGLF